MLQHLLFKLFTQSEIDDIRQKLIHPLGSTSWGCQWPPLLSCVAAGPEPVASVHTMNPIQ